MGGCRRFGECKGSFEGGCYITDKVPSFVYGQATTVERYIDVWTTWNGKVISCKGRCDGGEQYIFQC